MARITAVRCSGSGATCSGRLRVRWPAMAFILAEVLVLLAGLALVTYLRARHAVGMVRWVVDGLGASERRVAAFAAVPAAAAASYLIARGLEIPAALIVAALAGFSVFALALCILRMEGALTEPSSAAALRQATGAPPPSSPRTRALWTTSGTAALAAALYLITLVS